MKIENISDGKIIGVGEVSILPGETKEIPAGYEANPALEVYRKLGFARITGVPGEKPAGETEAGAGKKEGNADALRQARLASLNGISEEDLGKLANELGISPAACKDQADVLKKVKAALKK